MARPVGADAEATRGRILRCAARLFAEHGEGNTSMRDIGRAAGVSLATVHHYFGSKDDLYRASVDSMYVELEALREELTQSIQPERPLAMSVEEVIRSSFRFACHHRPAVQLVMRTVIDTEALAVERRSGLMLPIVDEAASILEAPAGIDKAHLRMLLQSMNHLIVRYALCDPQEMVVVVGGHRNEQQAMNVIEDHLVHIGLTLLGLEAADEFAHDRIPLEAATMGGAELSGGTPH